MTNFEELLTDTPECNEFRKLATGDWVAYSTRLDKNGNMIRAIGSSIHAALEKLRTFSV